MPMDAAPRRSYELESIVRRWLHAIFNQQPKTAVNLFSESDALSYIGTDEKEYWAGDNLRRGYGAHMSEADPSVMKALDVDAWECGSFGWARSKAEVLFQNADQPVLLRQSMVFLLEDGIWKIAHVHNSNPVPNVEVFGYVHKAYDDFLATVAKDDLKLESSGSATVMFTDIVGSSALAEAVGDQRWARLISDHLKLVDSLLNQFGGRLVKTMGDGTMSIFTSAGRALKAAAELQRAVDGMDGEPKLTIRVGLNTGDIVEAGDDFLGTVVNKAARIASIADPGEIRVSDATRAMVGNSKEYEFGSPVNIALKGLDGEHRLYRLEW
ncbi:adenylate/guanylate cyclase domain-containing protein [Ruegeria marina]|nr:adenylate/guanylate cyclase domain-containing protein [Ruegeria marina]